MRVFVYEWTCCAQGAPASLRREGWAMLEAVLSTISGITEGDTTIADLIAECDAYIASGERHFKFRRLADTEVRRMAIVQAHRNAPADKANYKKAA